MPSDTTPAPSTFTFEEGCIYSNDDIIASGVTREVVPYIFTSEGKVTGMRLGIDKNGAAPWRVTVGNSRGVRARASAAVRQGTPLHIFTRTKRALRGATNPFRYEGLWVPLALDHSLSGIALAWGDSPKRNDRGSVYGVIHMTRHY